jgi:hypothetical protein
MRTPGFTAAESLYRSDRRYRTADHATTARPSTIVPQQNETEAPGTCCGVHCPGLCACIHGHGECLSVTEPDVRPTFRMASSRVSMALDACHADRPVNGAQAFAVCPCGCWASAHDAGCFHCPTHHSSSSPHYLKA